MSIILRPRQSQAISDTRDALRSGKRAPIIVAPTGAGKCLGRDTPILMFDGTIKMVQDVRVGDKLMGPDSTPRKVSGTSSGIGPLYKVTPTKGVPYVVNDAHILSLKMTKGATKWNCAKRDTYKAGKIHNVSVVDYLNKSATFKHCAKGWRTGVNFRAEQELYVPPYFLGIWLGDGLSNSPAVCSADQEILQAVWEVATSNGLHVRLEEHAGNKSKIAFITGGMRGGIDNAVRSSLRKIGVLNNKHIPHSYLVSDRYSRLQLLAGLLDTDGCLSRGGFEFIQKNKLIADGVVYLSRSLGLAAYMSACRKKCVNNGKIGDYWRVSISGDCSIIPVRLERRRAPTRAIKKDVLVTGIKVEKLNVGEYFGFEIDGDRLFLLGDFTVTHNTIIGSGIIEGANAKGSKTLFLAHRHELIEQARNKLSEFGLKSGIIKAGHRMELFRDVQVASVQTLVRRLDKIDWRPDLIMIDEAHLSNASSYKKIVEFYGSPRLIGLTATPQRLDGTGLGIDHGGLFDSIIIAGTTKQLIEEGHLCPYKYFAPPLVDVSSVHTVAGEYDQRELEEITDQQHITGDFLEHWRKLANGLPTIVFTVSVKHAEHVAEQARGAGLRATAVNGESHNDIRAQAIKDVQSGAIHMLVNCGLFIEGLDAPALTCMGDLAATKSLSRFRQKIGRIMRTHHGKEYAIILDHVGNCMRHGLPDGDIDWMLEGLKKRPPGGPSLKTCPACYGHHLSIDPECPHCGYIYPETHAGREQPQIDTNGQLIQITELEAKAIRKQELKKSVKKARSLDQLLLVAKQFNMSDKWAANMWRSKQYMREKFQESRAKSQEEFYRDLIR